MHSSSSDLRLALAGLTALTLAMGVGRFAFTPLLPMMESDGLLSVSQGGLLASVHFAGYWVGALLAARLSFSPAVILQLSLVAIALTTLGMGLSDDMTIWLALRFFAGVFSAFTLVLVSNHIVKRLQVGGRSDLQGWVFSGVGAGIAAVGLGVLALMADDADSMAAWQITGAVSLALAVLLCLQFQGKFTSGDATSGPGGTPERVPLAWRPILAYGALGVGYIIPATYLPVMARDVIDAPLIFGWSWPVFGLAAFISTPLAIRAERLFSNRQIWAVSQYAMAAGLLFPAFVSHISAIIIAGVCVGGTFMVITMAGMKEAHRIAAGADVQRHIAVMTAAFATGQMIAPAIAGWAYAAAQSFAAPLMLASAALALTAILLTRQPREMKVLGS
ncbi:MAG: YbfB/YjiJ family MFS transporter [Hyphomicrobiaceae bacterium]|nr:YbfB/YjiJ family MFS transporter [Hyphomicrobiaceae bacterium]